LALSTETTLPLTSYRLAELDASGLLDVDVEVDLEPQAETVRPKIKKEQSGKIFFIVFSQF